MKSSLGNIRESLARIESAVHRNTEESAALMLVQTMVMAHHFGIMENSLRDVAFNTRSTAGNTLATALNTREIAGSARETADSARETAGNTQAIAGSTREIAGQMPKIVDTLNRQAQSQQYANWHAEQFTNWVKKKRSEDEQFRISVFGR